MGIEIRKAERRRAKLRLGIAAPSGSGKTYSSLMLAFGIGGKIGLVDTENGSGDLYAHLGDYDIITLQAPYTAKKYVDSIRAFEEAGYDVIIVDSLSHAWAGEGGLLDKKDKITEQINNSYTAWRKVTPDHNQLVEAMLQSKSHIIATMRSKQDYVQERNEKDKVVVRKVGLAPVQREGMEYEFTVMLDIDMAHNCTASKDRTGIFDGQIFQITKKTGQTLLEWLNTGSDPLPYRVHANGLTIDQCTVIRDKLKELKATEQDFLKIAIAPSIEAIQADDYERAIAWLDKHIAKNSLKDKESAMTREDVEAAIVEVEHLQERTSRLLVEAKHLGDEK